MIIGITGGTGAGKTTALSVLQELGAVIIDCDQVYHELLKSSEALQNELFLNFPAAFVDGSLNRKRLGAIVFSDDALLDKLNDITNKYILNRVSELAQGVPAAAIDAILLVESGLADKCDCTVAVAAPAEERIKRIMAIDWVRREYDVMRVNAQKSDDFYRSNCDYLLMNDGSESIFRQKCEKLFREILGGI